MIIRKATQIDAQAITDIYNDAILNTVATFDTETKTVEERINWLNEHNDNYPVLVAEFDETVIGWASLSKWSNRCAYDGTVEISIYFNPTHHGKGYGNLMMQAILNAGKAAKLHTVIARISDGNDVSIYLHKKHGFTTIGTLSQVGYKFNRFIDVHMMQLLF